MGWVKPLYSRTDINQSGKFLASKIFDINQNEIGATINIVDNFRAAHAFPLNTIRNRLNILSKCLTRRCFIAQRLKRFSSILYKLQRFDTMELWDMQDIGGCRAVCNNLDEVNKLVQALESSHIKHRLAYQKDYIKAPKDSGYRSRHLIYRYFSDRNAIYNDFRIEVQIRTRLQHAWATTVETVDTFTKQALKSSRGERDWERFFQLMGTWMAIQEHTPPIPGTPTDITELREQLRTFDTNLQVSTRLRGFASALRTTRFASAKQHNASFFLLSLDYNKERLSVTGYSPNEAQLASRAYTRKEKQIRGKEGNDAVLVSVDSVRNLRRAYPNYYADTREFWKELQKAIE